MFYCDPVEKICPVCGYRAWGSPNRKHWCAGKNCNDAEMRVVKSGVDPVVSEIIQEGCL